MSAGKRGDALGILVVSIQPQRDAAPDGEADNKRQNVLNRGFFHESSFSKTKINHSYCKPGAGELSSRWKHNKKQAEHACFSPRSVKFQSSIHAGKLYAISQKIKKGGLVRDLPKSGEELLARDGIGCRNTAVVHGGTDRQAAARIFRVKQPVKATRPRIQTGNGWSWYSTCAAVSILGDRRRLTEEPGVM